LTEVAGKVNDILMLSFSGGFQAGRTIMKKTICMLTAVIGVLAFTGAVQAFPGGEPDGGRDFGETVGSTASDRGGDNAGHVTGKDGSDDGPGQSDGKGGRSAGE
jgi:hypothetical protein